MKSTLVFVGIARRTITDRRTYFRRTDNPLIPRIDQWQLYSCRPISDIKSSNWDLPEDEVKDCNKCEHIGTERKKYNENSRIVGGELTSIVPT